MMHSEVPLSELRSGAIFITRDGTYAAKSQYQYNSARSEQCLRILLESGEIASFTDGNNTLVREVCCSFSTTLLVSES